MPLSEPPPAPSSVFSELCCLRQHNTAKHTHTKPNKPLSHSPSMSSTRFPFFLFLIHATVTVFPFLTHVINRYYQHTHATTDTKPLSTSIDTFSASNQS